MDCPAEPAEPIPAAHTDGPATEPIPAVPAAASTPPNIDLETGPPEQKPQPQPEGSEKMAPETEVPSKKIDDESAMPGMLKIIETQRFHHLKSVCRAPRCEKSLIEIYNQGKAFGLQDITDWHVNSCQCSQCIDFFNIFNITYMIL